MTVSLLLGCFELSCPSKCRHERATRVFDVHEQSIVRLKSSNEVEKLLCAVRHRNEIATSIDVFEVLQGAADGVTFKSVRAILGHTRNFTSLVLRLSFRRFRVFPEVAVFDRLVALDVNIPHATVAPFLLRHPQVENLTLGPCGNSRRCPLSHCPLPHLHWLTCPPSCVRALTSGKPVTWLAATYDGVEHSPFPILKVFDFRPIGTSAILTTLHMDFDGTSGQLLHRVSMAAPALQNLKLTESKFSQEVRHSFVTQITDHTLLSQAAQMPWDDVDNWEDGLRSLRFLKRFLLWTWQSLRKGNGAEDMLVRQWLIFSPPKLHDVVVWTGARQDQGRLVSWKLDYGRGVWRPEPEHLVMKCDRDNAPFY
jgi:hypothetical protein